jgi:DNA-binding NtrC family response regulator
MKTTLNSNTVLQKRIFIVDDDPFWAAMLAAMLQRMGYENIIMFESGTECVKNLHLNPALVFLDYQMDDMDGLEVLKKVREYFPGIGVIFCTAQEDLSVAVNAMKYGSFDYLLKQNATRKEVAAILENLSMSKEDGHKIY